MAPSLASRRGIQESPFMNRNEQVKCSQGNNKWPQGACASRQVGVCAKQGALFLSAGCIH